MARPAELASLFVLILAALLPLPYAHGAKLAVFGDSLSDTGNSFGYCGVPISPYYNGRYSDGPIWVDQVAAWHNLAVQNQANSGATAGTYPGVIMDSFGQVACNVTDYPGQILSYLPQLVRDDHNSTVYVIAIGANDVLGLLSKPNANISAFVPQLVGNIVQGIGTLVAGGAQSLVVGNLPPAQAAPIVLKNYPAAVAALAGTLIEGINAALADGIAQYVAASNTTANIQVWDIYSSTVSSIQNAPAGVDVSDACLTNFTYHYNSPKNLTLLTSSVCASPGSYYFWDARHPTTDGHTLVAEDLSRLLGTYFPNVVGFPAPAPAPEADAFQVAAAPAPAPDTSGATATDASQFAAVPAPAPSTDGATSVRKLLAKPV